MESTTKVRPQHQMAEKQVSVPTIVDVELSAGERTLRSIFVQWFGETDGPLKLDGEQFFFDTLIRPDDPMWMGDPGSFRVVFIGPIKDWPNPNAIGMLIEATSGGSETNIVWLMSPKSLDPTKPSSPMMKIVLLGDSNFGVIQPKLYCDMSVRDQVMTEVEANLPLAEKLLRNPRMELPPEEIPWNDISGTCSLCKSLEHSYDEKPGVPYDGDCHDLSYLCRCGRRWWQYNDYYHLWKHVTDRDEWDSIRRQQILKDAGYEFPDK